MIGKDVPFALLQAIAEEPEERASPRARAAASRGVPLRGAALPGARVHVQARADARGGVRGPPPGSSNARSTPAFSRRWSGSMPTASMSTSNGSPTMPSGASCGRRRSGYLRQAGLKAASRSALAGGPGLRSSRRSGSSTRCRRARQRWSRASRSASSLRPCCTSSVTARANLRRLREAGALAEQLNDDRRRGQGLGVHDKRPLACSAKWTRRSTTGIRALEIAERLGDLRLRILATSYLEQAQYLRAEYERVVELATGNLAAMPADWIYEYFGWPRPPSIFDRYWLVMSLAELGRFAEAAEHEAEAIRLTRADEPSVHRRHGLYAAGWLHLFRGDWAKAR